MTVQDFISVSFRSRRETYIALNISNLSWIYVFILVLFIRQYARIGGCSLSPQRPTFSMGRDHFATPWGC